jgi:hypothetical protein
MVLAEDFFKSRRAVFLIEGCVRHP